MDLWRVAEPRLIIGCMNTAPRIVEGGPIWIDLSTPDIDAAIAFYREMFGWEVVDPGPEYGGYHMIVSDGKTIGGMMSSLMGPDGPTDEPQNPPWWSVYVHTSDIDSTVARAEAAGGSLLIPTMDVGTLGKMAVVSDSAGAMIGLWQGIDFPGMQAVAGPGLVCWFECMTTDFEAALPFYRDVLGWDIHWMHEDDSDPAQPPADGGFRYVTHGDQQTGVAGLCDASAWLPEGVPSYWRVYLGTTDTDAALEKLTSLGGQVIDGPMDSPFGRLATVADPQGAQFQIITS